MKLSTYTYKSLCVCQSLDINFNVIGGHKNTTITTTGTIYSINKQENVFANLILGLGNTIRRLIECPTRLKTDILYDLQVRNPAVRVALSSGVWRRPSRYHRACSAGP